MKAPAAPTLTLRTRPAALWRVAVQGALGGIALNMLLAALQGQAVQPPPWLVPMTAVIIVGVQYLLFPARANAQGLLCFDDWGLRRRMAWEEIAQVELRRWPVLVFAPALRFTDTRGRRRWLPRETQNLAALHRLAQQHLPEQHPLLRALQTPLHAL